MRRIRFVLLTAALSIARPAAADMVLVCASGSPLTALSRDEAERLYLGRTREVGNGVTVTPLDLPAGTVRDAFYARLTGKNPAQIRAYWSRLVFTGRALPPREAASVEEAIAWVAANPDLVAYLPEKAITGNVRVLLRLP